VTRERRFLGDALMRSAMDPDALMVIEIDGMDSAKTILPHLAEQDKGIDKQFLIQYHLACVKHNGTVPDEVYYYTNELPHDSANTCTIIWLTLMKVTKEILLIPAAVVNTLYVHFECCGLSLNENTSTCHRRWSGGRESSHARCGYSLTTHAAKTRTRTWWASVSGS
jgi:hypothetical protein